jgi:hypothetical protein
MTRIKRIHGLDCIKIVLELCDNLALDSAETKWIKYFARRNGCQCNTAKKPLRGKRFRRSEAISRTIGGAVKKTKDFHGWHAAAHSWWYNDKACRQSYYQQVSDYLLHDTISGGLAISTLITANPAYYHPEMRKAIWTATEMLSVVWGYHSLARDVWEWKNKNAPVDTSPEMGYCQVHDGQSLA